MKNLFRMKKIILICMPCFLALHVFSQPVFMYGNNEVSKDEFLQAYNKNINKADDKEKSLRDYLVLYSAFKLKVKAAKELKLDTLSQLKYDMLNFRKQLEEGYMPSVQEALVKTNYKRNPAVKDDQLFRYADSVTLIKEVRNYPIGKSVLFSVATSVVKVGQWLDFVKGYKSNFNLYKGESYHELLEKFIEVNVLDYYRKHLEEYDADFKYQLQEFNEGNMMFEVMEKKVWNQATGDNTALNGFYQNYKDHFLWGESAEVILVNAKSFAYADYAAENMKQGKDWKKIAAESETMIQADSGRYELSQLPIRPGTKLVEGAIMEIVKNDSDNTASFVKLVKIFPARLQRSFDEARDLVINEYQKQLEGQWMDELKKKYPLKINESVFKSLLK